MLLPRPFANAQRARRRVSPTPATIDDLPAELLALVFHRCSWSTCSRARIVCKRWREVIDENQVGGDCAKKLPVSRGFARIFICDRRRAILERFPDEIPGDSPLTAIGGRRKAQFAGDQSIATGLCRMLAFRFRLDAWIGEYEVVEVLLQNFASFLERGDDMVIVDSRTALTTTPPPHLTQTTIPTPPSSGPTPPPSARGSPYARGHASASKSCSGRGSPAGLVPYNLLPSSRAQSGGDVCVHSDVTEEFNQEMAALSGGVFEHLASQLRCIRPLHLVFKDQSLYQKRPALLLFWFLNQVRETLRRVTFDEVQGETAVMLDRVLPLEEIDELNVVQPSTNAGVDFDERLLLAFLAIPIDKQRRFRVRLAGRSRLTATGICEFIKSWQSRANVVRFHYIAIAADTVSPVDFFRESDAQSQRRASHAGIAQHAMQNGGMRKRSADGKEGQERASAEARCVVFRHRVKADARIRCRVENGFLMFTFHDASTDALSSLSSQTRNTIVTSSSSSAIAWPPVRRSPAIVVPSSSKFSSRSTSFDSESSQSADEHASAIGIDEGTTNVFTRIFGFLLRSNA